MSPFSLRSYQTSTANAYTLALAAARAEGRALIDLSSGNPCECGLGLSATTIAALLKDEALDRYTPLPFGNLDAREAVRELLLQAGFAIPASDIMLTASTSEAYGFLLKLLCDPGDSVLVPEPSYPLFEVLAALEHVRLIPYRLAYDGEWHLTASALATALTQAERRPRAVFLVHPNNPTGSFLKRSELAQLAALHIPLVSDEVFAEYAFADDSTRAQSALEVAHLTLVFRMAGLSKSLALPQLKLAYTAFSGPRALLDEARARLEHIADAYLSPATPVQLALRRLLAEGPAVRAAIRARTARNLALLDTSLAGSPASLLRCEGGWYAIVRVPAVQSDEAYCLELLHKHDVIVQPGYFFDLSAGTYLVLSLLAPRGTFEEGAKRLRMLLMRHSPST